MKFQSSNFRVFVLFHYFLKMVIIRGFSSLLTKKRSNLLSLNVKYLVFTVFFSYLFFYISTSSMLSFLYVVLIFFTLHCLLVSTLLPQVIISTGRRHGSLKNAYPPATFFHSKVQFRRDGHPKLQQEKMIARSASDPAEDKKLRKMKKMLLTLDQSRQLSRKSSFCLYLHAVSLYRSARS